MGDHLGELALVAGLLAMDLDELEGAKELLNLVDQVTVGLAQDLAALFGGIPGLAQQPPEGGPRHQGQASDGRRQGEGQGQIHRENRQLGKQLQQKDSTHAHPADIRGQNAQEVAAVMLGQETPAGPGQGAEEGIPQVIDEAQLQPLGMPLPQQGHRRLQGDETDEEAQHEQQLALARDAVQQLRHPGGQSQRQSRPRGTAEDARQGQERQEQHEPQPLQQGAGQVQAQGDEGRPAVETPEFGQEGAQAQGTGSWNR